MQNLFHTNFSFKVLIFISIALFVFTTLNFLLHYKSFGYYFSENKLVIQQGNIFYKVSYIPLKNIKGFNKKSNIIENSIGLSTVIIKVVSQEKNNQIVIPFIKKVQAQNISNTLQLNTSECLNTNDYKPEYKMNISQLLKGSFSSMSIIISIVVLYSVYTKISEYIDIENSIEYLIFKIFHDFKLLIISIIFLLLLSIIINILKNYLFYGKFKLVSDKNYIYSQWGILYTYSNSFLKSDISEIIIERKFFMKLLQVSKISIKSSSKDKEDKIETNLLFPFIENKKFPKYLNQYFNIDLKNINYKKIPKKSVFIRLIKFTFLGLIILPIFYKYIYILFIPILCIYLYTYIDRVIESFQNKFHFSKQNIIIYRGGLNTHQKILKTSNLEEFILKQSFLQKIFNLCTLKTISRSNPYTKNHLKDISYKNGIEIMNNYNKFIEKEN
ncbi:PH domain-containing protein [Staphylococcus capitis]|nr:PH domain-containing protein [Staphylococcus capitis]MDS3997883.1 PH domain-containing protein [Staphylococcus capitis]